MRVTYVLGLFVSLLLAFGYFFLGMGSLDPHAGRPMNVQGQAAGPGVSALARVGETGVSGSEENNTQHQMSAGVPPASEGNGRAPLDGEEKGLAEVYFESGFAGKVRVIESLYMDGGVVLDDYPSVYRMIEEEGDPVLQKELIQALYQVYVPKGGRIPDPTPSQRKGISNVVFDLVENPATREMAINAGVNQVLGGDEIAALYAMHDGEWTDSQEEVLVNSYVNDSILNGKSPHRFSDISDDVDNYLDPSELRRRTQAMLASWQQLSGSFGMEGMESEFIYEQLSSPPNDPSPDEYVNWMIAGGGVLSDESERGRFLSDGFDAANEEIRHMFVVRAPAQLSYLDGVEGYVEGLADHVLAAAEAVNGEGSTEVYDPLVELRSIILYGNDQELKRLAQASIERMIGSLPDNEVSSSVLEFVSNNKLNE